MGYWGRGKRDEYTWMGYGDHTFWERNERWVMGTIPSVRSRNEGWVTGDHTFWERK